MVRRRSRKQRSPRDDSPGRPTSFGWDPRGGGFAAGSEPRFARRRRDPVSKVLRESWVHPIRHSFPPLADQGPNLLGDLRPATARSRMPTPIQPETSPMPADDGLGFDNLEDIHPAGPATRQV